MAFLRPGCGLTLGPRLSLGVISLLQFILSVAGRSDGDVVGPVEVCQTDVFNADCGKDKVIQIISALYGRMRVGTCVTADYGNVGCQSDVFTETDRRCSGRHKCTIGIPDKFLDVYNRCPNEFKTYFEATYKCIKVVTAFPRVCEFSDKAMLTAPQGYIANIITQDTKPPASESTMGSFLGVGSTTCPWVIHLRAGQRINITLYDFSRPSLDTPMVGGRCPQYAVITEKSRGTRMSERVCGEDRPIRQVYTSRSNMVEIRVISQFVQQDDSRNNHYFLLKYEAIGCAILDPPENGWVRQEVNGDIVLGCNFTEESWKLKCRGSTWTGERRNCSYTPDGMGMVKWGNLSLPYGVSVGIITGLAVIVGVIILLVGLICLEWNKMRHGPHGQPEAMTAVSTTAGKETTYSKQNESQRRYLMEPVGVGTPQAHNVRDNEYAYVREMWPMAPPPNVLAHSPTTAYAKSHTVTPDFTPPTRQQTYSHDRGGPIAAHSIMTMDSDEEFHIYESPRSIRRQIDPGHDLQYFELDPKVVPADSRQNAPGQPQRDEGRSTMPRPHGNVPTEKILLDESMDSHKMVVFSPRGQ